MKIMLMMLSAACALTVLGPFSARAQGLAPVVIFDYERMGQDLVAKLAAGDFEAAVRGFDEVMKDALPADKLASIWKALQDQTGAFRKQTGVRTSKNTPYTVVSVTCDFVRAPIDVQVTYREDGKVAGLFFIPTQAQATYRLPDYARPDSYVEKETYVGSSEWALPATLTLPKGKGPFPAVILVHGSGPHDRNESYGPNQPFQDLAAGLASRGIAVLRYEKRTLQYRAKMASIKERITVREETIDDALAAVKLLSARPEIEPRRIFVLGHSLGGMLLPWIGQTDPAIAGLIVMAGNTRPLEDLIQEQFGYIFALDGKLSREEQVQLDTIKLQVARVKNPVLSDSTPPEQLPLGVPARYWLALRGYRPAETAKGMKTPMLVLRAERDYQVTAADFAGWRQALDKRADVEFKSYPKLNHFFIEGEGQITPAEYDLAGNVAIAVIEDIAAWVARHYR